MAVFLHTRVRVSDLDKSIKWYQELLGFQVLSRSDKSPDGNCSPRTTRQLTSFRAHILRRL